MSDEDNRGRLPKASDYMTEAQFERLFAICADALSRTDDSVAVSTVQDAVQDDPTYVRYFKAVMRADPTFGMTPPPDDKWVLGVGTFLDWMEARA